MSVAGPPAVRVLVVDDEPNLVELVQGYLRQEGYAVETTGNGLQALELARAPSARRRGAGRDAARAGWD